MTISLLDDKDIFDVLNSKNASYLNKYYAFYSSWFGGITTNPRMMLLPLDDHMVHRGDGVFEAMKAVSRSVYLFEQHLQRLLFSMERIALHSRFDIAALRDIVIKTLQVANRDEALIRLFISRGPGNFSANPYDSIESQLYVAITELKPPSPEKYERGVVIGKSHVPVKSPFMAQVKSCNYLPNVLMQKEAVDRNLDYVIGVNEDGFVTESATENIFMVNEKGAIVYPQLDHILKGTTMIRVCELAIENKIPVESRPIKLQELLSAPEVLITGTSLNVLPVVRYEDHTIGSGQPGPYSKTLQSLLLSDIHSGPHLTPF